VANRVAARALARRQLERHAQTVPFYDYLLSEPREAWPWPGGTAFQ
jgi:hypothetical protein